MKKAMTGFIAFAVLAVYVLLAIGSCSISSPLNKAIIDDLNDKETDVLALSAGAATVSIVLTVLPNDIATPLAEEVSDLAGYCMVATAALFFEKYFVTLSGVLCFFLLIPAGAAFWFFARGKEFRRRLGIRLIVFGLVLYLILPFTYLVNRFISNTYEESISASMEATQAAVDSLADDSDEEAEAEDDRNFFERTISAIGEAVGSLTGASQRIIVKAKAALNRLIEAAAIMIITCLVMPIAIIFLLCWLVKLIFGVKIDAPDIRHLAKKAGPVKHKEDKPSLPEAEE